MAIAAELQFSVKQPSSSSIKAAASLIVPIPAHVHVRSLPPTIEFQVNGLKQFDGYMLSASSACGCVLERPQSSWRRRRRPAWSSPSPSKLKLVLEYLSNASLYNARHVSGLNTREFWDTSHIKKARLVSRASSKRRNAPPKEVRLSTLYRGSGCD